MNEQLRSQLIKKLRKIQASISRGSELAYDVEECLAILGIATTEPKPPDKYNGLLVPDAQQIDKGIPPSATGMITTNSLGWGQEPVVEDVEGIF